MRKIVVGVLISVFTCGCFGVMDEKSGGDHVRGKAKEVLLNTTHDDHVSADDGDHTDWKKFNIPAEMKVTLDAYWDDPSVDALIRVKDQFGGAIFELKHERGKMRDNWPNMKMREGEFYLEVVAKRGASVYTLELTTGASGGTVRPGTDTLAPPE